MEIWKDIKDYEGLYQVSNMGNVYSIKHHKVLVTSNNNSGYLIVTLCKDGVQHTKLVHRLVAEAFIQNPENKPQIDHIDTNPHNNIFSNLRWATQKENMNNCKTIEKFKQLVGSNNGHSKSVLQFTKDGQLVKKWGCIVDVKRELGVCKSSIVHCCKGKRKTAGGYVWKYYDTETYLIGLMNKNIKVNIRSAS